MKQTTTEGQKTLSGGQLSPCAISGLRRSKNRPHNGPVLYFLEVPGTWTPLRIQPAEPKGRAMRFVHNRLVGGFLPAPPEPHVNKHSTERWQMDANPQTMKEGLIIMGLDCYIG
jgi:hypothetical protein